MVLDGDCPWFGEFGLASRKIGFWFGVLLVSGSAVAQEPSVPVPPNEGAFFDPLPVVLSVSRLAQPLADAPGSVTVIDAAAIRSSGARDLASLLRTVPGFLVAGSTDGAPMAVYHGMTDENPRGLQILIDGRSQYSPLFFGGVSWNLIDVSLDDIDRIEVIRGSNSAAYGSNAFLGVVNVITRAAADTAQTAVRVSRGNDGVDDRYARVGMNVGGAFVRLSAERRGDDGVVDAIDDRRNDRVNLRVELPLGVADELQFQAGRVTLALDAGAADDTRSPPRGIDAHKDFVSAAWMRHGADGGGASLRYAHSRERYEDVFIATDPALDAALASLAPALPPATALIDQRIRTARDEVEFQHTVVTDPTSRLVWGLGERYDRVFGEQFYGTSEPVVQRVQRLFGHLEWRPGDWVFNLGATWEDDSLSDDSLAPRLSANYHLSRQQTLRVGVTRAHRIPTLTESLARTAYGTFDTRLIGPSSGVVPIEITRKASGHLQQERIDVQEIGYLGDFRAQHLFVDVRLFHEKVSDRIVPVMLPLEASDCELAGSDGRGGVTGLLVGNCGKATDFINGQEVEIRGLEYQLRWRPRRATELTLNQTFISIDASANGTFMARDIVAAREANQHMEHSAPKVATMLRWQEHLPLGLEGSVTWYRYGRFQWTSDSSVASFERTDLRLAYAVKLGGVRGEVSLVVEGGGGRRSEFRSSGTAAPEVLRSRSWLGFDLSF